MPIYEHRCNQCGEVSEILTGVGTHSDLPLCKKCGSTDMEKLMSVSSYISGNNSRKSGTTCCGVKERCDTPPCSDTGDCRRG